MSDNAVRLICELHKHDGAVPIGRMVTAWHRKIDEQWEIWVNGQLSVIKGGPRGDVPIHPGDCYAEYNGWPAGSFSMITGEGVLAAGERANYEAFCEALQNALTVRA
jgi:hypothetical protein